MLLLNDILPEEIVHIEYDTNEIDLWKGDDKKVIMDVLCHTKDGRKIIVEMQRADKEHLRKRLVYYGASMIHTELRKGDSYGKMMPVYVICFMNFRSMFDNDVRSYLTDEDRQEIAEEYYAKGRTEGKAEGKAEVAKALKDLGIPANDIAQASGLTLEEIEDL